KHPKSFVSLDTADHLLRDAKDARYAAETIAAWSSRYLDASGERVADGPATSGSANTGSPSPASGNTAPAFKGGALAVARSDAGFAADLSIDGHPFTLDAEEAEGGSGLGPNPTRTVEAALAGCAVMTMRMYARRKGWSLDRVEVEVRRAAGTDSHVATELEKDIRLEGAIDDDQRARLVEIADKCPVHRMLSGGVSIKTRLA
ncbi:MAG: OsmC family protein, partial [Pseudomonadota bacterium]